MSLLRNLGLPFSRTRALVQGFAGKVGRKGSFEFDSHGEATRAGTGLDAQHTSGALQFDRGGSHRALKVDRHFDLGSLGNAGSGGEKRATPAHVLSDGGQLVGLLVPANNNLGGLTQHKPRVLSNTLLVHIGVWGMLEYNRGGSDHLRTTVLGSGTLAPGYSPNA